MALKMIYALFLAFMDFINAITEQIRCVGVMQNRPDMKANMVAVSLNMNCCQKISSVTIVISQITHESEEK